MVVCSDISHSNRRMGHINRSTGHTIRRTSHRNRKIGHNNRNTGHKNRRIGHNNRKIGHKNRRIGHRNRNKIYLYPAIGHKNRKKKKEQFIDLLQVFGYFCCSLILTTLSGQCKTSDIFSGSTPAAFKALNFSLAINLPILDIDSLSESRSLI